MSSCIHYGNADRTAQFLSALLTGFHDATRNLYGYTHKRLLNVTDELLYRPEFQCYHCCKYSASRWYVQPLVFFHFPAYQGGGKPGPYPTTKRCRSSYRVGAGLAPAPVNAV